MKDHATQQLKAHRCGVIFQHFRVAADILAVFLAAAGHISLIRQATDRMSPIGKHKFFPHHQPDILKSPPQALKSRLIPAQLFDQINIRPDHLFQG